MLLLFALLSSAVTKFRNVVVAYKETGPPCFDTSTLDLLHKKTSIEHITLKRINIEKGIVFYI